LDHLDETHVRRWFLHRLGIRLGPESSAYVLRRLRADHASALPLGPLPVMGGDALTGVPLRRIIDPKTLEEMRTAESPNRVGSALRTV
jgi:hypothetical protein